MFAGDLEVSFLGTPNFKILRFQKILFNLGLKGVIEKCVGCFLEYLFFSIKKCKKNVFV